MESASDENCDCRLRLGCSKHFEDELREKPKCEDSQTDVLKNIFSGADEQKIFNKCAQGMRTNYGEVLDGTKKNLNVFPPAFDYDSRIETSVVFDELAARKTRLEEAPQLSEKEEKELTSIQKFVTEFKPQAAEGEVFQRLICFFYANRGLFLHSYKLDTYLKRFVDEAKNSRKQAEKQGINNLQMTELEKNIAKALVIQENSLDEPGDKVVNKLREASNTETFSGTLIRGIIKDEKDNMSKNCREKAKHKFKTQSHYNEEQIKTAISLSKYQDESCFPGEMDFLVILPDRRLFINVEVKCQEEEGRGNGGKEKMDPNLHKAAGQLKRNSRFIARILGNVLGEDWKFLKVAAISPFVANEDAVCSSCKRFILTNNVLKQPGGMLAWWNATQIRWPIETKAATDQRYQQFLQVFNRMVNLSLIGKRKCITTAWEQIQGTTVPHGISAAGTSAGEQIKVEDMVFEDTIHRPHDSFKILFYNPDQRAILSANAFFRIIFCSDYGSGEYTILVSYKCISNVDTELES